LSDLKLYLARIAHSPMVWGVSDCATLVAGWVEQRMGQKPLLPIVTSQEHATRLYRRLPLLDRFRRETARLGLIETAAPVTGDIGVVSIRGVESCAIRLGEEWVLRGMTGISLFRASHLFAVRVP
jgi:hypothetical protein